MVSAYQFTSTADVRAISETALQQKIVGVRSRLSFAQTKGDFAAIEEALFGPTGLDKDVVALKERDKIFEMAAIIKKLELELQLLQKKRPKEPPVRTWGDLYNSTWEYFGWKSEQLLSEDETKFINFFTSEGAQEPSAAAVLEAIKCVKILVTMQQVDDLHKAVLAVNHARTHTLNKTPFDAFLARTLTLLGNILARVIPEQIAKDPENIDTLIARSLVKGQDAELEMAMWLRPNHDYTKVLEAYPNRPAGVKEAIEIMSHLKSSPRTIQNIAEAAKLLQEFTDKNSFLFSYLREQMAACGYKDEEMVKTLAKMAKKEILSTHELELLLRGPFQAVVGDEPFRFDQIDLLFALFSLVNEQPELSTILKRWWGNHFFANWYKGFIPKKALTASPPEAMQSMDEIMQIVKVAHISRLTADDIPFWDSVIAETCSANDKLYIQYLLIKLMDTEVLDVELELLLYKKPPFDFPALDPQKRAYEAKFRPTRNYDMLKQALDCFTTDNKVEAWQRWFEFARQKHYQNEQHEALIRFLYTKLALNSLDSTNPLFCHLACALYGSVEKEQKEAQTMISNALENGAPQEFSELITANTMEKARLDPSTIGQNELRRFLEGPVALFLGKGTLTRHDCSMVHALRGLKIEFSVPK